jgi:hypothetical protein
MAATIALRIRRRMEYLLAYLLRIEPRLQPIRNLQHIGRSCVILVRAEDLHEYSPCPMLNRREPLSL